MKIVNQMKTLIQTFRIIGTIMVSLNLVGNVAAEKTQVINFPSGKMIQLDLRSGAELNVEVWHKQEVEISYHDKTQDLANYKIAIDEVISGIKISSSLGHSGSMQLKFNLKVPQQTQLCLFSSGGNIKVSGLNGGLSRCSALTNGNDGTVVINSKGGSVVIDSAPQGAEVKTAGGTINITNASNFVVAETGGGSINIETSKGNVNAHTGAGKIKVKISEDTVMFGDIKLVSGLGDIWLYLPKDFSMNLDVEIGYTDNTNGQFTVNSDFELGLQKSDKPKSYKGTPRQYLQGNHQVNGGRHSVKIKTTNGNVYIREIKT